MTDRARVRHRHSRAEVRCQHLRARERVWRDLRRWYDESGTLARFVDADHWVIRQTVDRKPCRCAYCSHRRRTYGLTIAERRQRYSEIEAMAEVLLTAAGARPYPGEPCR